MMQDPISVLENGAFVECNQAALDMLKLKSRNELIGKFPWEVSPERQNDGMLSKGKVQIAIAKCVAEGVNRFEWSHLRADGVVFSTEIILTLIPEMEVETIFVLWRDITDKVKAEENAEKTKEKYEVITENAPTAILIHKKGKVVYANKTVEEIFGFTPEYVVGRDIFEFVHPSQKEQVADYIAKRIAGEYAPNRYDLRVVVPDESEDNEKWLDMKVAMAAFEGEEAILINCVDITNKVIAEQKLRETSERYRTTLNSIGDAVIATDVSGNILMMNPVAQQLTGWSIEEAAGGSLERVFVVFDALTGEKKENPVEIVLKGGKATGFKNHTVLHSKNGNQYQITDSGAPIRDESGNVSGVVLVFKDVTEKYILEEQLRQSQKMEAVELLASGLAHDFNNMLSGIIGSAEVILSLIKDKNEIQTFAQRIKESALNANNLTRQLLDFSRKTKPDFIDIEVSSLIHSTVNLVSSSMGAKINIKAKLSSKKFVVKGDKARLQNAFVNLLFNSKDAMVDGGTIELSTSEHVVNSHFVSSPLLPSGKYVKISIKDSGSGIDKYIIDKVFDPYFTTKPAGKGTGLGLAMVKKTMMEHRGTVSVVSKPDKGSIFELYLPIKD